MTRLPSLRSFVCAVLGLTMSAAAFGCASPAKIDLRVVIPQGLVPERDVAALRVEILAAETNQLVATGTLDMAELASAVEVFDAAALHDGHRYVARVSSPTTAAACSSGRLVGRSVPFTHASAGYVVPITLGCAERFVLTRRKPNVGRAATATVALSDGSALVVGGARTGTLAPLRLADLSDSIERFEPKTGGFVIGSALETARALPGAALVAAGRTVIAGGALSGAAGCSNAIEDTDGQHTRARGRLAEARCAPNVTYLPALERVVVTQGARSIESYDGTMSTRLAASTETTVPHAAGRTFALADGESVLIVGGTAALPLDAPAAERVRFGGACGDAGCVDVVAQTGVPREGLRAAASAWAACTDVGGAPHGGAVYVLGGMTGGASRERALDDVYCYRDLPGVTGSLVRVGVLPEGPRRSAVAETMLSATGPKLVLVGGTRVDDSAPLAAGYRDALIFSIDPCACELGASERVALDGLLVGESVLQSITALADGALLVTGGVAVGERLRLTGTDDSYLMVPDFQ